MSKRQPDKAEYFLLSQHGNIHINTTINYKNQNYSWEEFSFTTSKEDYIRNFKMLHDFREKKLAVILWLSLYYTFRQRWDSHSHMCPWHWKTINCRFIMSKWRLIALKIRFKIFNNIIKGSSCHLCMVS